MKFQKSKSFQALLVASIALTSFSDNLAARSGQPDEIGTVTSPKILQLAQSAPLVQGLPPVFSDNRPPTALSLPELKQRAREFGLMAKLPFLPKRYRKLAKKRRAQDKAEIARRKTAANPPVLPAVLTDNRPPQSLSLADLRQRASAFSRVSKQPSLAKRYRKIAKTRHAQDRAEIARRTGITGPLVLPTVLHDSRPPRALSSPELRKRANKFGRLINRTDLAKRYRKVAKNRQAQDLAELNRRTSVATPPVLRDRRPAQSLPGNELKARVALLRIELQRPGLPRKIRVRLSRKLAGDRTELRRRVASRRNPDQQLGTSRQPETKLETQAKRLLGDYRTSRGLNDKQLRRRIKSAHKVLKYVAMAGSQRRTLKNMIAADRAEKRRRLLAARDRRKKKMKRLRLSGKLNIQINPGFIPPPRGDIAAAEADDRAIQRQFLAPPKRAYQRRYSREEIIRRPELTRSFAGIDVDTINFGFNEYWIREEEIDEIERMAVAIEEILAVRPYEVFQVEGHTDAVGSDTYNLGLSRQRARAVKDALTKFFVIPPQNLVTVGLGERYLKIPTPEQEPENRRVTLRRITPIIRR